MKILVIDASVVAAALFQEDYAESARACLASEHELHAPDLIVPELASVIWKRHGKGEIDATEAGELLSDFLSLPLRLEPSVDLVESALEIALVTTRTVYDCMYVALAAKTKSVVMTGDRRLTNALAGTPFAKYIACIGAAP